MKKMIFFFMILVFMMGSCSQSEMDLQIPEKTTEINNPNFVSVEDAMKNVEQHYAATFTDKATRAGLKVKSVETFRDLTRANSGDDMYGFYIINFEDNMGFSIVSADARRIPVYAISDEGSLTLSDTIDNKGLSWYINQYMPLSSSIIPPPGITPPIKDPFPFPETTQKFTYCEPLLTGFMAKFHQDAPYNKYCFNAFKVQAPVGCGPLAVGTVMAFLEWPKSAEGHTFNWTAMKNNSTHDSWARFFEILGRGKYLNAIYTSDATYTSREDITSAFYEMGYKNSKYTEYNTNTVAQYLSKEEPVLIAGTATEGGHIWVVDGGFLYRTLKSLNDKILQLDSYYFHCVWGWGGTCNGYFVIKNTTGEYTVGGKPSAWENDQKVEAPVFKSLAIVCGYEKKQ